MGSLIVMGIIIFSFTLSLMNMLGFFYKKESPERLQDFHLSTNWEFCLLVPFDNSILEEIDK